MPDDEVYDEASSVTARDGKVSVKGPDAVDVRLTPEAADETADRLIEGAAAAAGQRRFRELGHQPGSLTPRTKPDAD